MSKSYRATSATPLACMNVLVDQGRSQGCAFSPASSCSSPHGNCVCHSQRLDMKADGVLLTEDSSVTFLRLPETGYVEDA